MRKLLLILILLFTLKVFSQNHKEDEILKEGKLLYRLERSSWFGTDHFIENFKNKKDSVGGYLSYESEDQKIITIFFNKFNNNKVLIRYKFDENPTDLPIEIDSINHLANEMEKNLIEMRLNAKKQIYEIKDNFFTFYNNVNFNIIPIIKENKRIVFVLSATKQSDVFIIGNDYKLTYNSENKLIKKEKIHNSIIQFEFKVENKDKIESTFHSHVLDDKITSTDICTLLLYRDYVNWKQHYVLSKKYVSIFDTEKEVLIILKRKDWEKIYKK